jgi:hypothetical protein
VVTEVLRDAGDGGGADHASLSCAVSGVPFQ